jgi:hypothetical protein
MWSWVARVLEDGGLIVAVVLSSLVVVFLLPAALSELVATYAPLPRWVYVLVVLLSLAAVVGTIMLGVGVVARPGSVSRQILVAGLTSGVVAEMGILVPLLGWNLRHSDAGSLSLAGALGVCLFAGLPIGAAWSVWVRHRASVGVGG